jgi:fucose permease
VCICCWDEECRVREWVVAWELLRRGSSRALLCRSFDGERYELVGVVLCAGKSCFLHPLVPAVSSLTLDQAAASLVSLSVLLYAFRRADAAQYHSIHDQPSLSIDESSSKPFTRMLKYPALYLASLYFLTYCGIETAISGWIVSFTLRYLHASPYLASLSSSGFWIGMASGRLLLGHSTDRIGVRRAATIYLLLAIVLQAAFAFMRAPVEAVVLMTLLGVFMGPLFPSGVVVLTRLLPPDLHVRAVSFIVSLGQVGGAALPFGIGVFVESAGVGVFRWVILLFTILSLIVWIAFSRLRPAKTEGYATTPSEEDVTDD